MGVKIKMTVDLNADETVEGKIEIGLL